MYKLDQNIHLPKNHTSKGTNSPSKELPTLHCFPPLLLSQQRLPTSDDDGGDVFGFLVYFFLNLTPLLMMINNIWLHDVFT